MPVVGDVWCHLMSRSMFFPGVYDDVSCLVACSVQMFSMSNWVSVQREDPTPWTDKPLWKHYLPLRSVTRMHFSWMPTFHVPKTCYIVNKFKQIGGGEVPMWTSLYMRGWGLMWSVVTQSHRKQWAHAEPHVNKHTDRHTLTRARGGRLQTEAIRWKQ